MSSRRRGVESGFIGQNRNSLNDSGYDEVYAGDTGNPSGFAGISNKKYGQSETGFAGMAANKDSPNDIAQINYGGSPKRDSPGRGSNSFRGTYTILKNHLYNS